MKIKKQPEVRFDNYTDEWKMQALKHVANRVTRKNKELKTQLPLTISAQYGLVDQVTYFNKQVASKDMSNYYLLERGEFAYNKSYSRDYPWGAIKRLDNYDMGALSSLYITFKPVKINSDFLLSYYDTNKWHKEVSTRATEGARNHGLLNISANDFLETELAIPLEEEQEKVGSFFKQLDEAISLYQQELDALKQTKQGFLQKMFPKEGETVPELRFPEFVEDWKVETLNNVANYRRGSFPQPYGNKEWYDKEHGMPFVQVVDVDKNLKLVDNTKQKISKLAQPKSVYVEAGRVVVTLQGSIGRVAITQYPSYVDRTLLIFENYKFPVDTFYFAYSIQLLFNREKTKAPGGTIKTITKEALSSFPIFLPNIEEQIQIGKFLKQLDDVIALQEQELDALKQTNQAFLQKMFV